MEAKQAIIKRLQNVLKGQAMYIKEGGLESPEEKLIQLDVIVQLNRFLSDYDNNVKLLNSQRDKETDRGDR